MKVALAQYNYHIGNFESNIEKIISGIEKAKDAGANLVVFAELAICGYPPLDFLEFEDFIRRCQEGISKIAQHCTGISAIVGGPAINTRIEGKNLFNAAFMLEDGKIKEVYHKGLLPNYDVFDEYRYFEPGRSFKAVSCGSSKVALTVCEDLWDIEEDKMYTVSPMDEIVIDKGSFMINIAASPFSYTHSSSRKRVLSANARRYGVPLFYVNHVGAQTELIFDGGSLVYHADGTVADELNYFSEDFRLYEVSSGEVESRGSGSKTETTSISKIHDALVLGVKDYFSKMGFKKAILGLSGGIDSAVVLCIAKEALGAENVLSLLLPSPYSTSHSISDAEALCKNLGTPCETIRINDAYEAVLNTLSPWFKDLPFNVAEENIQSRLRGLLLMAFSNKFGQILLNTSNKSELAVGYGTLYGDMAGGISVIGDLYKTQVYELAGYINRNDEIIPANIITKAPSAELRPGQKDSDSLPEYDILDKILLEYIENRKGPRDLIAAGFEKATVDRILKLVNTNEYKRKQFCPILRVSNKAFGLGRRMPIVGKYLS